MEELLIHFIDERIYSKPKSRILIPCYEKVRKKCFRIMDKLKESLSEEQKEAFYDYDNYFTEMIAYQMEDSYINGFKDCFNLILKLYK